MGSTSPALYVYLLVAGHPFETDLVPDTLDGPLPTASTWSKGRASGARGVGPGCVCGACPNTEARTLAPCFPVQSQDTILVLGAEQLQPFTDTETHFSFPECRTSKFRSASSASSPFQSRRALRTQDTLMGREYGMQRLQAGHHGAHLLLGLWPSSGPNTKKGIQLSHSTT